MASPQKDETTTLPMAGNNESSETPSVADKKDVSDSEPSTMPEKQPDSVNETPEKLENGGDQTDEKEPRSSDSDVEKKVITECGSTKPVAEVIEKPNDPPANSNEEAEQKMDAEISSSDKTVKPNLKLNIQPRIHFETFQDLGKLNPTEEKLQTMEPDSCKNMDTSTTIADSPAQPTEEIPEATIEIIGDGKPKPEKVEMSFQDLATAKDSKKVEPMHTTVNVPKFEVPTTYRENKVESSPSTSSDDQVTISEEEASKSPGEIKSESSPEHTKVESENRCPGVNINTSSDSSIDHSDASIPTADSSCSRTLPILKKQSPKRSTEAWCDEESVSSTEPIKIDAGALADAESSSTSMADDTSQDSKGTPPKEASNPDSNLVDTSNKENDQPKAESRKRKLGTVSDGLEPTSDMSAKRQRNPEDLPSTTAATGTDSIDDEKPKQVEDSRMSNMGAIDDTSVRPLSSTIVEPFTSTEEMDTKEDSTSASPPKSEYSDDAVVPAFGANKSDIESV